MKKTAIIVTIILIMGMLFVPLAASASADGFYNLSETSALWDGTDANRTSATSADYDYTYGDETSLSYSLPWPFSFYGTTYSQVNIDTNGNIWLTASGFANSFNLATTERGPVIAAWNNDLSSYYYGGVFVQHKSNPERVVIEWQTETYTEEGYYAPNDFEVVLFPNGTARFDYKSFTTAYGSDFGSGISKGDGSASLNLTSAYGNAFSLAGRSFAFVIVPKVQITSPVGMMATNTPTLGYSVSNGTVTSVQMDGIATNSVAGQSLDPLSDGSHTVTVIATNEGVSTSVSKTFTIDTTPPQITITGVTDGGYYNTDLAPSIAVTDANLLQSAVSLNGVPYSAGSPVTAEGKYALTVTAQDLAGNSSNATANFIIDKTAPESAAAIGLPQLANNGIVTVSGQTRVTITAIDRGAVPSGVAGIEYQIDSAGSWYAYTSPISFAGVGDGNHTLNYRAYDKAGNWEPTHTLTVTVDSTAPVVSASPSGGIYAAAKTVTLSANEAATIYFTTDGTTPSTDSTIYSQPITISASSTLRYLAKDPIGNISDVRNQLYVIDTTPPTLSISTLRDGAYTNNATLNVAGSVADDSGIHDLQINGNSLPFDADGDFSNAVSLQTGPNTITTVATDLAGNQTSDTRTVILDETAPVLAITIPPDNSKTANAIIDVNGTVDRQASVFVGLNGGNAQTAGMDGLNFTATVSLVSGYNTIEVSARDLAGKNSTVKRTVIYDDQKPSLAVTAPNQDTATNQSSMTIKGTASDPLTAVGITVTNDGQSLHPPLVNGSFEQIVSFTDQKNYPIVVTATNDAGSSTTVQRNVIYDATSPSLTIDPVTSPTYQKDQILAGTRESGRPVEVTSATATVGTVTYPSAGTWQATVSGMQAGENEIVATSADAAGNQTKVTAKITLVLTAPEVAITADPSVLWPPDHRMVPVKLAGGIVTHGSTLQSISISVADQYGKYSYRNLKYGDTVLLEAWRNGSDLNGRVYTVTAVATDNAGNTTTKTTTVVVPHDVGK